MNMSIPNHIACIMDGNRRWAKKSMIKTIQGHSAGANKVKDVISWCISREIKYLTIYAFSSENWHRSKEEINDIMSLVNSYISDDKNIALFNENEIKIRMIGSFDNLDKSLAENIKKIEDQTCNFTRLNLQICFNYGSRAEIVDAVKSIITSGENDISEELISSYLYTSGIPDLDLIIRTGGMRRLSNFLLWQASYSELFFIDTLWPDFSELEFDNIISEYKNIKRNFGT